MATLSRQTGSGEVGTEFWTLCWRFDWHYDHSSLDNWVPQQLIPGQLGPPTTHPLTTGLPKTGSPTTGSPTTGSPTTGSPTTRPWTAGSSITRSWTTGSPTTRPYYNKITTLPPSISPQTTRTLRELSSGCTLAGGLGIENIAPDNMVRLGWVRLCL